MWPFKKKPNLFIDLKLIEHMNPANARSNADADTLLLYSQAQSLKRIADSLDQMGNLPDKIQNAISEALWAHYRQVKG